MKARAGTGPIGRFEAAPQAADGARLGLDRDGSFRPGPDEPGGRPGPIFDSPRAHAKRPRRARERAAVLSYRAAAWVLARTPTAISFRAGSWLALAVYAMGRTKRRWIHANYASVLGRGSDDPRVGRLARRGYQNYARYLIELMRLPSMSPAEIGSAVDVPDADWFAELMKSSRGVILVGCHVGSNEAAAAGIAGRGFPFNAVGDDTAYRELYELLSAQRATWGVRIIPWGGLREAYRVLRRGEVLGLLVDWGYRPDGLPVRVFGRWTTLPAGPALLAARTGATLLPFWVRRTVDGRYVVHHGAPTAVTSTSPAELLRATQHIGEALEAAIGEAPEQWHTFRPFWPESEAERDRLAAAARTMVEGR